MKIIGCTDSLRACKKAAPKLHELHTVRRFQFDRGVLTYRRTILTSSVCVTP
jgi:hypothetical protein